MPYFTAPFVTSYTECSLAKSRTGLLPFFHRFRPFNLPLAPTICPWVSEDVAKRALWQSKSRLDNNNLHYSYVNYLQMPSVSSHPLPRTLKENMCRLQRTCGLVLRQRTRTHIFCFFQLTGCPCLQHCGARPKRENEGQLRAAHLTSVPFM